MRGLGQKEAMEDTFRMQPPGVMKGTVILVTAVKARRFRSIIRVWVEVSISPILPR